MLDRSPDRLRIGLDFDDTLMQTREGLVELFNSLHSTSVRLEECTEYHFSNLWNITDEQFAVFFNEHEKRLHDQPAVDGLMETLKEWAPHADFYVVTGRPECWLASAVAWLNQQAIPVVEIIAEKAVGGKGKAARLLNLDFFIDDHATFAEDVANAGIPVFLLDRPYNQQLTHPLITRVKDWQEIRNRVDIKQTLARRKQHEVSA